MVAEVFNVRVEALHAVDGNEVAAISVVVVPVDAAVRHRISHDRRVVVLDSKAVGGHHVYVVLQAEGARVVFDARDAVLGCRTRRGHALVVELDVLIGFGPNNLEGVAAAVARRRNTPVRHVDEAHHQGVLIGEEIALRRVVAARKIQVGHVRCEPVVAACWGGYGAGKGRSHIHPIETDVAIAADPNLGHRIPVVLKALRKREGSYDVVIGQAGDLVAARGDVHPAVGGRIARMAAVLPGVAVGVGAAGGLGKSRRRHPGKKGQAKGELQGFHRGSV